MKYDKGRPCYVEFEGEYPATSGRACDVCGEYLRVHDSPPPGVKCVMMSQEDSQKIARSMKVGNFVQDSDGKSILLSWTD